MLKASRHTAAPGVVGTRGLPRYEAYEDTGVEWLKDVPEHWELKRLEHFASYRTSSVDKKTDDAQWPVRLCNYTDVYYQNRIRASDGGLHGGDCFTARDRPVQVVCRRHSDHEGLRGLEGHCGPGPH